MSAFPTTIQYLEYVDKKMLANVRYELIHNCRRQYQLGRDVDMAMVEYVLEAVPRISKVRGQYHFS
jgi:hypothetical protein